jgi:hypothetical protein
MLRSSEKVLRLDLQGGQSEPGWPPPQVNTPVLAMLFGGLHGIPDATFLYATHVRDARSNCKDCLVSNDIDLSRVWGPCCGMFYRLTIPLILDAAYVCTQGSIRAGRRGKIFWGL